MEGTTGYAITADDVTLGSVQLDTALLNFNRMINVNVHNAQSLLVVAINEFRDLVAAGIAGTAPIPPAPAFYSTVGNRLYIYPFPAEHTSLALTHYVMVRNLTSTIDSNGFTENHPSALLWAALAYGSKFIVEDDRGAMYEQNYLNEVEVINKAAKAEKMGSTPLIRKVNVYAQVGVMT
jgi:hypothetical protein